jgi:hypothetical protein
MNVDQQVLKYLSGIYGHFLKKLMLFKSKTVDEAYAQAQYLENIGHKKGQPSGSKHKENHNTSKEVNNKGKSKEKNVMMFYSLRPFQRCVKHLNQRSYEKCMPHAS